MFSDHMKHNVVQYSHYFSGTQVKENVLVYMIVIDSGK